MDEIDWNAELRRIMRQFDGLPPEPTPEELRARRGAQQSEQTERQTTTSVRGMLARIGLVLALAAALPLWPYATRCGPALAAHLASITVLVVGGSWTAACAWHRRMPKSYVLSLVAFLWALALGAQQVLPRTGYAIAHAAGDAQWHCARR